MLKIQLQRVNAWSKELRRREKQRDLYMSGGNFFFMT